MAWGWLIQIVVAVAMAIVSYALAPKPKRDKPKAAQDMEAPTADAGRPIPVVFGSITISGSNVLGYWDTSKHTFEVEI